MNHHKAPFITFEGGEGSGKSTQALILYRTLLKDGIDVVSYREPGGTKSAEDIRELLLKGEEDRWTPVTEALLMSAARAELVQKRIVPKLEAGTWVICDRFADSTIAYQGFGHKLGYTPIETLNHFTIGPLKPDLTFVFQLPPELGLERISLREGARRDRYEKFDITFHRRAAEGYAEVIRRNPDRCVAINALLDIDTVSKLIFDKVRNFFRI